MEERKKKIEEDKRMREEMAEKFRVKAEQEAAKKRAIAEQRRKTKLDLEQIQLIQREAEYQKKLAEEAELERIRLQKEAEELAERKRIEE